MANVEEVFKAAVVPIDFEVYFMIEVHSALSSPITQVTESIRTNGMCLKGILVTPLIQRFWGEGNAQYQDEKQP